MNTVYVMAHEMIPERTCQRGQVTMAEWRWEEWKWHHGLVEWLRRLWAGGAGRRQTTTPLQMKPHIGSVPHGTSQNLRKKASCHMHVILWGHFVTYNIHFHIPGQQGEYSTHTHIHSVLTNNCVHLKQKTGNRRLHLQAGAHYGTKEFLLFILPMYI